jgi:hypothetical protein
VSSNGVNAPRKLKDIGLELDVEPTQDSRLYLDKRRIKNLLKELSEHLNFTDLMAVKSQINEISKKGKLLPLREQHMKERRNVLSVSHGGRKNKLTMYVVEH